MFRNSILNYGLPIIGQLSFFKFSNVNFTIGNFELFNSSFSQIVFFYNQNSLKNINLMEIRTAKLSFVNGLNHVFYQSHGNINLSIEALIVANYSTGN